MPNNILNALRAAEMGFSVFPTDPNNKRPLVRDWPNVATRDPEKIRELFAPFRDSMIGAVTGEKSGYFVIDVDVKNGECAFEKVKAFEALHGERLIPAFATKTGSGGLHLFYNYPENVDIRNSASQIGDGWDVRSNGGYVIFAGSVKSDGKKYEFINYEDAYNGKL